MAVDYVKTTEQRAQRIRAFAERVVRANLASILESVLAGCRKRPYAVETGSRCLS